MMKQLSTSSTIFISGALCGLIVSVCASQYIPDLHYFIEVFFIDSFKTCTIDSDKVGRVTKMVIPVCIDRNLHMNNSRYIYETNFTRRLYLNTLGIWSYIKSNKMNLIIVSQCIRYRKEMRLFQRYTIETKIIDWNDKEGCFYVETKFISDKFVCAVHYVKYLIVPKGNSGSVPSECLQSINFIQEGSANRDANLTKIMQLWEDFNCQSSTELNPIKNNKVGNLK